MAASPKSVFLGIVAFGLPFALTTGWMLGAPRSGLAGPDGAGGFGRAPISATSPMPSRPGWAPAPLSRPNRPGPVVASSATAPIPAASSVAPASPSASPPPTTRPSVLPETSVLPGPTVVPSLGDPEATTRPSPDLTLLPDPHPPAPAPPE